MSETERLRRKLAQLKSGDDAPGDDLPEGLIGLAPILAEIDDTVLSRELLFVNDRGERVGLVVSGRRLLMVSQIRPRSWAARFGTLAGRPLTDEATHEIGLLKRLLTALLDGAETLEISAARPDAANAADIGCTTDTLKRLLAAAEPAEPDGDAAASALGPGGVLAAVAVIAQAALIWEAGAAPSGSGAPEDVDLLAGLAETRGMAAVAPAAQAPRCTVLRLPAPDGRALAHVALRGWQGLFLLRAADAFRVMRLVRPALSRAG